MTPLTYQDKGYGVVENSNYVVIQGIVFEIGKIKNENELQRKLSDLLTQYGPHYQPTILEEILRELPNTGNLERTVNNYQIFRFPTRTYRPNFDSPEELGIFLQNTERIVEVDYIGESPSGKVLGLYDLNTDTIYVLRNLNPDVKTFVRAHERAHRRRHFTGESQDEQKVDLEATAEVGFDPLKRFSQYSRVSLN